MRTYRILIVDDEEQILNAFQRCLRKEPYQIVTATSGEQALQVLESSIFQLVLSDFNMRGMDGVDFLTQVKHRWPAIRRIMITGRADFTDIERAINECEVHRFLNKPWKDDHLRRVIQDCLDHQWLSEAKESCESELTERNQQLIKLNQDLERRVTERSEALVQTEKMAALGHLAGGVAHEINNPLGGILAFVQVLLRDSKPVDSETHEMLEVIQSCALRCKEIVDNLLSFSRLPDPESTEELDMNAGIRRSVAMARLHPEAQDLEIQMDLNRELTAVKAHPGKMEQVLVNLLQNAMHASVPGQTIRVSSRNESDSVAIEVQDHGQGIAPNVLPHIFEPFFTTKDPGEGTGLGLAICFRIVNEMGGELKVDSKVDQGTTFTIKLPVSNPSGEGYKA